MAQLKVKLVILF